MAGKSSISAEEKSHIKDLLAQGAALESATMLPYTLRPQSPKMRLMVIQYRVFPGVWKDTPDQLSPKTKFDRGVLHGSRWVEDVIAKDIARVFNTDFGKGESGKKYRAKLTGERTHIGNLID